MNSNSVSVLLLQRLRGIVCGIRGWIVGRDLDVFCFFTNMVTRHHKFVNNCGVVHEIWDSLCYHFIFLYTILSVRRTCAHVFSAYTLSNATRIGSCKSRLGARSPMFVVWSNEVGFSYCAHQFCAQPFQCIVLEGLSNFNPGSCVRMRRRGNV